MTYHIVKSSRGRHVVQPQPPIAGESVASYTTQFVAGLHALCLDQDALDRREYVKTCAWAVFTAACVIGLAVWGVA